MLKDEKSKVNNTYSPVYVSGMGTVIPFRWIGLSLFQTESGEMYQMTVHGAVKIPR